jgi:hypothetical protein
MAGADLFREKSIVGSLLVAGLLREKNTAVWWLVSQTNRAQIALSKKFIMFYFLYFSLER